MALSDPISIFVAEDIVEAQAVLRILGEKGIEAYTTGDEAVGGDVLFGKLPDSPPPLVWINSEDATRAAPLLARFEQEKLERIAERKASEGTSLDVICEKCGKATTFAGSLRGSVQECAHCGAYVDVGDY